MLDLKSKSIFKCFVAVSRKKGDLGVCSQKPEMLGQIFTDSNVSLKLLSIKYMINN